MRDKEKGQREEEKRRRPKWPVYILILALVLGVVVFAAYRDGTGFDVLRRYFQYGKAEEATGILEYEYDTSSEQRFAMLGNHLVVLSKTSLSVLDGQGGEVFSTGVKMEYPALHANGGRAVCYDVGGTELYVVDEQGKVWEHTVEETEPIISARLNGAGWLTVTAGLKNHKGGVWVYNADMEEHFLFRSSRRFVSDAYVTDDCKRLAAVTMGQEGGVFVSDLVFYNLNEKEPFATCAITDGLVTAMGQDGDLVAVCDSCLAFVSPRGELTATYDYGGAYLREYTTGGDDFTALLLNRYTSGSVGRLVTVGGDGEEVGSLDIHEEVLHISAAGRYLAVLYADRLVVYNSDLRPYATLNGTDYARSVLMRSDGSAILLGSETAKLFLP
ncbi:MAG: hypothetical protein IJE22_02505 [Oscillibacter sp.]|nr:hypothetical protein [Oscillibacter sp.]